MIRAPIMEQNLAVPSVNEEWQHMFGPESLASEASEKTHSNSSLAHGTSHSPRPSTAGRVREKTSVSSNDDREAPSPEKGLLRSSPSPPKMDNFPNCKPVFGNCLPVSF